MGTPQHFTDLIAWQKSHLLVMSVYSLAKQFPDNEKYGLCTQLQRAAISITANIAEGFDRYYYKERIRFYYYSRGSLSEVENFIIIAKDLEYISYETFKEKSLQIAECKRILNGLIKSTKTFNSPLID